MKKILYFTVFLLIFTVFFSACKKSKEDTATLGTKAGLEMCACYEDWDNECFKAVETKYEKYLYDELFASAFVKSFEDCMITSKDPEAATAGKQAGIEDCACDQLKDEDYEKCKEIWHNKYEKYLENVVFLYFWEIEYKKCSE